MQGLLKLVKQLETQKATSQQITNTAREYLQVMILKSIYHSKYSASLSFMGGTALRICYDTKRFSEDMDFALDRHMAKYSFSELLDLIRRDLGSQGYVIDVNPSDDKIVHKAFIKFSEILHRLDATLYRKDQKIHIKLEIDTNPVKVKNNQIESFFVTKFGEIFPILKHRLETLFAGKIAAVLERAYTKGRDYYDLIWFLSRKTDIDIEYLNEAVKKNPPFNDKKEVMLHLKQKVEGVHPETILKDIVRFLDDPTEEGWLKGYQTVFKQLSASYLAGGLKDGDLANIGIRRR